MKPENLARCKAIAARLEDTIDGDFDGEGYVCYIDLTQEDIDEAIAILIDEVGGPPPMDDWDEKGWDDFSERVGTDNMLYNALWELATEDAKSQRYMMLYELEFQIRREEQKKAE